MSIITPNNAANTVFNVIDNMTMFGTNNVVTIIVDDKPWFKAKNIAEILEYKHTIKAINNHVSANNKKSLGSFELNLRSAQTGTPAYGDKQTIYINEAGLYQLIMKSKQKVAEAFQDWVTNELLPQVRQIGYTKVQEILKRELDDAKHALEEKTQAFEEGKKAQALLEKRELKLRSFIDSTRALKRDEILYIGTTVAYQNQNRFKVGGTGAQKKLKARFSSYNTGRPRDDFFFCAKTWEVHSHAVAEQTIKSFLSCFKDNQDTKDDMYHLHGASLVAAIDFIVDNLDKNIEWLNANFKIFTSNTLDAAPVKFEPIPLAPNALYITDGVDNKVEIADTTDWSEEKIQEEIAIILELYNKQKTSNVDLIQWSEMLAIIRQKYRKPPVLALRSGIKKEVNKAGKQLIIVKVKR